MEFQNSKLLPVVQERLATVLAELGLTSKISTQLGDERIIFANDDDSIRHSVAVCLPVPSADGEGITLEGASLSRTVTRECTIGDNDWKSLRYHDPINSNPLWGNPEKILRQIEKSLRQYKVFRQGDAHPDLVDDLYFPELYDAIEWKIRDISTSAITIARTDGVISVNFVDETSGDHWSIALPDYDAELSINGKIVARSTSGYSEDVAKMFFEAIEKYNIPNLISFRR